MAAKPLYNKVLLMICGTMALDWATLILFIAQEQKDFYHYVYALNSLQNALVCMCRASSLLTHQRTIYLGVHIALMFYIFQAIKDLALAAHQQSSPVPNSPQVLVSDRRQKWADIDRALQSPSNNRPGERQQLLSILSQLRSDSLRPLTDVTDLFF